MGAKFHQKLLSNLQTRNRPRPSRIRKVPLQRRYHKCTRTQIANNFGQNLRKSGINILTNKQYKWNQIS